MANRPTPNPAAASSRLATIGDRLRSADRYLISASKCEAALTTDCGQSATGYLADVSAKGCCFVTDAGQLNLRPGHEATIVAGDHRFDGRIVRSHIRGPKVDLGIEVPTMPEDFFARVRELGGAIRWNGSSMAVVGKLTMPVATQGMRLLSHPDMRRVDLGACTGMELAGAGFIQIAAERGVEIANVAANIEALVRMAGIRLDGLCLTRTPS